MVSRVGLCIRLTLAVAGSGSCREGVGITDEGVAVQVVAVTAAVNCRKVSQNPSWSAKINI